MKLSEEIRDRAVKFRKQGCSLAEISYKLGISKSTASVWLRGVQLSKKAKKRIARSAKSCCDQEEEDGSVDE
jgi:transposase-like protein